MGVYAVVGRLLDVYTTYKSSPCEPNGSGQLKMWVIFSHKESIYEFKD